MNLPKKSIESQYLAKKLSYSIILITTEAEKYDIPEQPEGQDKLICPEENCPKIYTAKALSKSKNELKVVENVFNQAGSSGKIDIVDKMERMIKDKNITAEAVAELTEVDKSHLQSLIIDAQKKLEGSPIRIPHQEHRDLHLEIFRRLDNPFVQGLLEAYWEAYEAVELNVYTDINYLLRLWQYHALIIDGIINDDIDSSLKALVEHTELLNIRDT